MTTVPSSSDSPLISRSWTPAYELEVRSAAITLSDMEVFVFPELMFSLVLANLMSPRIWRWRDDPWFAGLGRLKPYRRLTRLKQYIMDHYAFNLDLETWGLTTRERELERFRPFIHPDVISRANALFGYEGDKYYFDIDIRTHFGLNKYDGDVIPYWKTETVEAMDAFRRRPGFDAGAGECVSLATLYAAAAFIVADIPLRDIFLMATPLHSQNFFDMGDGVLTNNRRLVTKAMWFNGTALSAQARRALEHEQVTLVAHESGCVHSVYAEADMDPAAYARFSERLGGFLRADLTPEIVGNFVRHHREMQRCFQLRCAPHGAPRYIGMEHLLRYEEGSPYRFNDGTREALLGEVESEEFHPAPFPGRIVLNDLEEFVKTERPRLDRPEDVQRLRERFVCGCFNAEMAIESLLAFCRVEPRLPDAGQRRFVSGGEPFGIEPGWSRDAVFERIASLRDRNRTADLAFHAFRDLTRTEHEPFLKAAMERNPVCRQALRAQRFESCVERVAALPEESIYDGPGRLAQPDEAWNFGCGDGVEKAVLLAAVYRDRDRDGGVEIEVAPEAATLRAGGGEWRFASRKALPAALWKL